MQYYYTDRNLQPQGPVSLAELQNLASNGILDSSTLLAEVGSDHWVPANVVIPSVPVAKSGEIEPLALYSLILSLIGIAGFTVCCLSGAISIPAVVLGHMARAKIKKFPELPGNGLAVAGLIIGYISIGLMLFSVLFFGGFVAFASIAERLDLD